jgi:hypothetical protein
MALEITDTDGTEDQFEDEYSKAVAAVADGVNPWHGMTYVEGVRDTLAWLSGDREEAPLEELSD